MNVQCTCGKRTMVSDALAGRMIRCPGCGNEVLVGAAAPGKGKGKAAGGNARQASPAVSISRGQVILVCVIAALLVIGGVFYFGPMRVSSQWAAMEPKATQDVQDLVIDSLREKMKEEIVDPKMPRRQPTVETGDVTFFKPMLCFTMPDTVPFIGKSNQGSFGGNYNTRTGQLDATVSSGGYAVAGLVDVKKPTGSFHLTGRMVDGKPEMEMDGRKI